MRSEVPGASAIGSALSLMPATLRLVVFLGSLAVMQSCVAPGMVATAGLSAAQAGVSEFYKGRLKTAWDVELATMFQVVHSALHRLGYKIEGERATGNEWFIGSRELDGTGIEIYLRRSSPKVTMVSIRVGMFGDQPLSRLISDTFARQLESWRETARDAAREAGLQAPTPASPPR